jgi:putative phosphoesterase
VIRVRIGVVSDTHNHLGNVRQIVELFNRAGVDRVVHTGDITQAKTLDVLAGLHAPLSGVFGNNDLERDSLAAAIERHRFHFEEPPLRFEWAGRRVVVVHDPRDLERGLLHQHELSLHGHTHLHVCESRSGSLVFNPGECAGHLRGHNAVGVVDLVRLDVEILRF